jgi:hypothetical protein
MRVAALCAEPDEREEVAARMQTAFELEERVMTGRARQRAVTEGGEGTLAIATWVEEALRAVLRETVRGNLGAASRDTADEVLVAAAVSKGEGSGDQMGETAEWEAVPVFVDVGGEEEAELMEEELTAEGEASEIRVYAASDSADAESIVLEQENGYTEENESEDETDYEHEHDHEHSEEQSVIGTGVDWLSEIEHEDRATLEWPSVEGRGDRERVETPRVRHLFPVPDDTDWDVGELEYSRDKARVNR